MSDFLGQVSRFAGSVKSTENVVLTRWLRQQRLMKGLTMRQLGIRLNIPHSYISKIEHCERRLDVVEYLRYCDALEINPFDGLSRMSNNVVGE